MLEIEFNLLYYLKMSLKDIENLPLKIRDWYLSRLYQQLEQERKDLDAGK